MIGAEQGVLIIDWQILHCALIACAHVNSQHEWRIWNAEENLFWEASDRISVLISGIFNYFMSFMDLELNRSGEKENTRVNIFTWFSININVIPSIIFWDRERRVVEKRPLSVFST